MDLNGINWGVLRKSYPIISRNIYHLRSTPAMTEKKIMDVDIRFADTCLNCQHRQSVTAWKHQCKMLGVKVETRMVCDVHTPIG
jgi:hypothetical protein